MRAPEAPLFIDPVYAGAADPTVVWNRHEKLWFLFYTQRPATLPGPGVTHVHGSDIGIASSPDGHDWLYRGTAEGLAFEHGRNTFWAPEVLYCGGTYHMYVSYVQGMPVNWDRGRKIVHYTSRDLWEWKYESALDFGPGYGRIIDACAARCPGGVWRMWFKNEEDNGYTYMAESRDLYGWTAKGPAVTGLSHEGPNVFFWKGSWWLVADMWRGLCAFRSQDALRWERAGTILDSAGSRPMDDGYGHHAKVLVCGEEAYIFYFVHQSGDGAARRLTALQAARLHTDGRTLACDRDEQFDFALPDGDSLGHYS